MGPQILIKPVGTARIQGMSWRTVCASSTKRISKLINKQDRGQTKGSCSWGLQGGVKVDPTIPISPTLQYDELLSMLASNAISMETKQRVMKRAVSTCPTVNCFCLNVQGKEVPSLMDLGSMVTLIWEGYFEKNILPILKASSGGTQ